MDRPMDRPGVSDESLFFDRSFTQQEAIPESAIEAAVEVMRSGRLHRYNTAGEGERSVVDELELAFARYQAQEYALACASGGYALQLALRAAGVEAGETVLTNAFTLSPVPGAILAVGARAVLVETTDDLVIDIDDLARKLDDGGAKVVLLSHMRGHLVDMQRLCRELTARDVTLIEDCAHTMGARFADKPSGSFGLAGCFSTQTYKHINSGEGGLISSDDADFMARAILLSGSYMLYERHAAGPGAMHFEALRTRVPNLSGRMDNLRAALLLPQLAALNDNAERWRVRYRALAETLAVSPWVSLPKRHALAEEVPSSLQFRVPALNAVAARSLPERCRARGVELKWFGAREAAGYTSSHAHWGYLDAQPLPVTDRLLAGLYDVRLPLTFDIDDCRRIGRIIVSAIEPLAANEISIE